MNNKKIVEIPSVTREVHGNSFLKSVQWLFSYPAMGDGFVDNLQMKLNLSAFKQGTDAQNGFLVSASKDGLWILANTSLMVMSISGQDYVNFDSFLPKITTVLDILEAVGVPKINITICIKRNFFEVEKTKEVIKEEDIISQLFSEEYRGASQLKESLLCKVSGCEILLQRAIENTVTKTTIEFSIESVYPSNYILTEALPVLHTLNDSCYSAWHFAMSPRMIEYLDKNKGER